jgi:hypothetical protein
MKTNCRRKISDSTEKKASNEEEDRGKDIRQEPKKYTDKVRKSKK